ncbi:hypothetical protein [Prosthecobacter fluviatilis]|uniref:DUF3352 domain-containing protein n=1 Tax=Prosthecobacter fluviatilis TaxID=445931 RepID=A0ABW0KUN3_9BACT
MKRASLLFSLLLTSILPASAADRLEQWYNLMPKNTVGVIAIKNTPELLTDWDKSSYAKFMQDDEAKRWMSPMRKDGDAPWDKFFKDIYGTGMYDTLKEYPGAVVSYLVIGDISQFDKNPPNVSLCEVGGKQKEIEAQKLAEVESKKKENPDLKLRTEDIGGVSVQIAALSDDADAPWVMGWGVVGDVMIEANTHALMEYMVGALKNNAGDPPGAAREHLTRIGQFTNGGGDMMIYFNGVKLLELGEQALTAAEAKKKAEGKANAGMGLDFKPQMIMDMLGAKELQAFALTAELTDTQSRMDMTILHPEKPSGLLALMRGTSNEVSLPAFIPAGILTASVSRMDFGRVYDSLLGMLGKLGPMSMMVTMQLAQFEGQLGFKIRDDLFGSLSDEVIQAQDGAGTKESQVMGFKIKDADKLGGALEGLKRYVGAGFGAFEESDYLGFAINALKVSQTSNAATEVAYCNTGKYLLISIGGQDTLKKVLGRMKDPSGPSIWETPHVQSLLSIVPKNYNGVGVTDAGRLMTMVATAAAALESKTGAKAKTAAKKKGPGKKALSPEEAVTAAASGWFDSSARPSNETFERYFGSLLSASYSHPDAIQVHYLTTPVEAK